MWTFWFASKCVPCFFVSLCGSFYCLFFLVFFSRLVLFMLTVIAFFFSFLFLTFISHFTSGIFYYLMESWVHLRQPVLDKSKFYGKFCCSGLDTRRRPMMVIQNFSIAPFNFQMLLKQEIFRDGKSEGGIVNYVFKAKERDYCWARWNLCPWTSFFFFCLNETFLCGSIFVEICLVFTALMHCLLPMCFCFGFWTLLQFGIGIECFWADLWN